MQKTSKAGSVSRKIIFTVLSALVALPVLAQDEEGVKFLPVSHASFVMYAQGITVYVDPVGEASAYKRFPRPDIILITHTHQDHLNKEVVTAVQKDATQLVGPRAAVTALGFGEAMANGESKEVQGIRIEAVPAYNITKERMEKHPKGEGNGYVLTIGKKRVYISGDTEDTPEMRSLKDIDYAFVCMNLPFTMSPEQAAAAVRAFKPRVVFPYHYRQKEGVSDVEKFRKIVAQDKNITVELLEWYPKKPAPKE